MKTAFIVFVSIVTALIIGVFSIASEKRLSEKEYCASRGNASLKDIPAKCIKYYTQILPL